MMLLRCVLMAKKKKPRIKIRVPLPLKTQKVHSTKKGAKGYSRPRVRKETREAIREESSAE